MARGKVFNQGDGGICITIVEVPDGPEIAVRDFRYRMKFGIEAGPGEADEGPKGAIPMGNGSADRPDIIGGKGDEAADTTEVGCYTAWLGTGVQVSRCGA